MTFRLSHLAALLAATMVATAIWGGVATWRVADEEFRDVLDEDLESQSRMLARLLASDSVRLTDESLEKLLRRTFEPDEEETLWVTVHDLRDGSEVSNLRHALSLDRDASGSLQVDANGHRWHGYQSRRDDLVVQLVRREDLYAELQQEILEDIVTPAVAGSLVNLCLLAALTALLFWPLSRLVREIEARSPDSLAPLALPTPATEIAILRDTLNRLIGRVDATLRREREFASDVAHELRTPLTTLKLELASPDPDLPALKSEIDRVSRLVTQLLTLARLEEGLWRERFAPVSLADICSQVLQRFEEKLGAAGLSVRSSLAPATVSGDPALLEILLQNLVTNVLEHCPRGTEIDLTVATSADRVVLEVSDTGPGIAEPERARMTERFARFDQRSEGLGLGLAICHKIAQAHGATLAFLARDDGRPGLRVQVAFPALMSH